MRKSAGCEALFVVSLDEESPLVTEYGKLDEGDSGEPEPNDLHERV
jgi:hypothetical protein